jgi:TIR domain
MKVFISYTREKDDFDDVSKFASHLQSELRLYALDAEVFQDKTNIAPGEHFDERIWNELDDTNVLLIFVSPSWLRKDWCRKEFARFEAVMANNASPRLVLPLLFIETAPFVNNEGRETWNKLKLINWVDWTELRHEEWNNPSKLKAISKLAKTIAEKVLA